jgi:hypothetical protein
VSVSRRPPLGLQVICVLGVLDAGLTLLRAALSLGFSALLGAPLGGIGTVVSVVFALGQLAVVWGLWELQSWAWSAAVFVFAGSALTDALGLVIGRGGFGSFALTLVVLLYLLAQRDLFRRRAV